MLPPDVDDEAYEQADKLARRTERELIARISMIVGHAGGSNELRQIDLEMLRRNIEAGRQLKASNDRASLWLIVLTIAIGLVALVQLLVALHVFG